MPKPLTCLILSLSWGTLGFNSANAELFSKERLAKCEMHAVDGDLGLVANDAKSVVPAAASDSLAGDVLDEPLAQLEKKTIELAMQIKSGQQPERKKTLLGQLLRQSFDLQTVSYQSRIDGAKKNVLLLEKQLEKRNQNSDAIVAKRLAELIEEKTTAVDAEDPRLAAERFSSEGWELWAEQDFSAAIVKFEKAVELDPSFNAARNGLGWSQFHLQRHRAAAITFRELLADEPQHGGARNGLGMSLMAVDDNAAAKKEFLTAVGDAIASSGEKQAAKMGMAAWFGLVQSLQKLNQQEEARSWADRYLAHNDDANMKRLRDAISDDQ